MFLVVNQPDEKHDGEIETPDEKKKKKNTFSFFPVEIHDSFLDEKHTHGKNALPAFLLMDFAEENGHVYEA